MAKGRSLGEKAVAGAFVLIGSVLALAIGWDLGGDLIAGDFSYSSQRFGITVIGWPAALMEASLCALGIVVALGAWRGIRGPRK